MKLRQNVEDQTTTRRVREEMGHKTGSPAANLNNAKRDLSERVVKAEAQAKQSVSGGSAGSRTAEEKCGSSSEASAGGTR